MRENGRLQPFPLDPGVAEKTWDLGCWRALLRTQRGSSNLTFFVATDSGEFVLRVSNPRKTVESISWEVSLLDHLADRGFPVPRVVPTRDGAEWASLGGSICLVTERLPGDHPSPDDPVHAAATAQALGWFHAEGRSLPAPAMPAAGSELPRLKDTPELLYRAGEIASLPLTRVESDLLAAAVERLSESLASVDEELARAGPLPEVVTHGSLGASAVLFDGDRLSAVLDFERSAVEARALDFAYMARGFTRSATDESLDIGRLALLVDAYRRREEFPEVDALPLALRAQRLLRVRRKAANFLAHHGAEEPHPKDGLKLLRIAKMEAARISWLEQNREPIVAAIAS